MATLSIGALQWRLYSPDTPDLVAPYLVDFTQYGAFAFAPRGAQALLTTGSVKAADGVVIDNMTNGADVTVIVGAITEFVPRYQKVTLMLPGISAPDVILSASAGTTRVTFFTGAYHGTGSNINGYASNKAGAVATVTDGTIDAYFNSLRWKINFNLAAGFNLDNITDSGFYDVLNPTNGGTALPAGTWYIEHHTYSSSNLYAFQIARNLVAPKAAIYERRLLGGAGWSAWAQAGGGGGGGGQCQLLYAGTGAIVLNPKFGNRITVNGQSFTIPQAGIQMSNAGLGNNAIWDIYLSVSADGATGTLQASGTTHVLGADGTEVMQGNAALAYVGKIRTDASGNFQDTPKARGVASWFNRRPRRVQGDLIGPCQTASSSYVELSFSMNASFLSWADMAMAFEVSGTFYSAGAYVYVKAALDSSPVGIEEYGGVNTQYEAFNSPAVVDLSEGWHTIQAMGHSNGSTTGNWYAAPTGIVWI